MHSRERRDRLDELLVRTHVFDGLDALFRHACAANLEGIVSKRSRTLELLHRIGAEYPRLTGVHWTLPMGRVRPAPQPAKYDVNEWLTLRARNGDARAGLANLQLDPTPGPERSYTENDPIMVSVRQITRAGRWVPDI